MTMNFWKKKKLFGGDKSLTVETSATSPVQAPDSKTSATPTARRVLSEQEISRILYFRSSEKRDEAFQILATRFGSNLRHIERRDANNQNVMYERWIVLSDYQLAMQEALKKADCDCLEVESPYYYAVLSQSQQCDTPISRWTAASTPVDISQEDFLKSVRKGDLENVKALLKQAPDLLVKCFDNNRTPLHDAAMMGQRDVVEYLLTNMAEVNAKTDAGWTPLHEAANNGHSVVVKLLLASGADINARTNRGDTPLRWASRCDHEEVVNLLSQHGGLK